MIGLSIILLGCLSLYLGLRKLKDYRQGRTFGAIETTGLHPLWGTVFKLRRFNAHVDIWIFFVLGPMALILGIVALLRGD